MVTSPTERDSITLMVPVKSKVFFLERLIVVELLNVMKDQLMMDKLQQALIDGEHKVRGIYPTGKYRLTLLDSELELLLDQLSDELASNGIDVSGELNTTGYQLEKLIDLLSGI